jgi:sec-independent protein translocase protein TatA
MPIVPAISFGMPEMLIVAFIVLVLFGAGKLPAVFKQLGSGIKEFKDAQKDDALDPVDVTPAPKAISSDTVTDAEEVGERVKE